MQYSKLQESPMRQLPSHNQHDLVSQSLVSRYIRSEATRPSSQRPVRRDMRRLRHDISSLRYELADKMKDTGKCDSKDPEGRTAMAATNSQPEFMQQE